MLYSDDHDGTDFHDNLTPHALLPNLVPWIKK